MKPSRWVLGPKLRRSAWPMFRVLLVCVALPTVFLLSAEIVAQKTIAAHTEQKSDDQIASEINSKLMVSNTLRPLDLGVWVHDGTATLSGTVPSLALKQQAETLVHSVSGVKKLDDQLTIGTVAAVAPGFPAGASAGAPPQRTTPVYGAGEPVQQPVGPPVQARNDPPPRSYQARPGFPLLTVPVGTPLNIMMMQTVDSHHTKPGTGFRGIVMRDVAVARGVIAVPRGAFVEGVVIDARPPGHLKGRPVLALQLTNVNIGNLSYVLTSNVWGHEGLGKGGETAQAVGGGAAFGAITGAIVGGGPTALLGAALGGLGGAGLSALSAGPHLLVPAESVLTFRLNAPLTVREPTTDEVRTLAANLSRECYNCRRRRYYPGYPAAYSQPAPGGPPGGYPY